MGTFSNWREMKRGKGSHQKQHYVHCKHDFWRGQDIYNPCDEDYNQEKHTILSHNQVYEC